MPREPREPARAGPVPHPPPARRPLPDRAARRRALTPRFWRRRLPDLLGDEGGAAIASPLPPRVRRGNGQIISLIRNAGRDRGEDEA
jgi:hypothetical protein